MGAETPIGGDIFHFTTSAGRKRRQRVSQSVAGVLGGEPRLPRVALPPEPGRLEPEPDEEPGGTGVRKKRVGQTTLLTGPLGLAPASASAVKSLLGELIMDANTILKRVEFLESERSTWEDHWSSIARLVWPMADEFQGERRYSLGEERSQHIFDATAALALEKFAAALESLLTPRSQKWHRLRATNAELDDDPEVQAWLETLNERLFEARTAPGAGYYSHMHEAYKSLGAFGSSCLFVGGSPTGAIRYRYCHIGRVFIEVDQYGVPDTTFRRYESTARAAFQKFGDAAGGKVLRALGENPYKTFEYVHAVMPNEDVQPGKVGRSGMPWASFYVSCADKEIVRAGGYHENPYMFSRYTVNPREKYGQSPAMLTLPTIRMLQEMQRTFIRSGHKVVDPPLLAHDDGVLGTGSSEIRILPGGITYGAVDSNGKPLVIPLQTGARLDLTEGMLERERAVINDAFLVSLFQILVEAPPNMTATQALLRAQEKGELIAPTVGRQQSEFLGPQISREIGLATRSGMMDDVPMPPQLVEAEGEYEIEYVADSARLQRSGELAGADRTVERAMAMGEFDPAALRILNVEEILRLSQEVEGAPASILRSPEELEEINQIAQRRADEERLVQGAAQVAALSKDAMTAEATAAAAGVQGPPGAPV